MRVRWHGHSCFELEDDKNIIVTDPHDGKSIGINPPQVKGDVILVSHDHYDHNAVREVQKQDSDIIREAVEKEVNGIKIKGFESYHDEEEGEIRGKNIVFKFKMNGTNFCHLGDLGHLPKNKLVEEIGEVDFLFVPVGGNFTIGAKEAKKVIDEIKPKIAVPMHFKIGGLSLDIGRLDPLLSMFPEDKTFKVGVELDFIKHDLPDSTEIWAFSL